MNLKKLEVIISILIIAYIILLITNIKLEKQNIALKNKDNNAQIQINPKTGTAYYELVSEYNNRVVCYYGNCLFKDNEPGSKYVFGLAKLNGFFTTTTRKDKGNMEVECSSFVITDGNQELINSYTDLIKTGNTMNIKNDKDQIIININLTQASDNIKEKIINSTETSPVELTIFKNPPTGKGDDPCSSSINIIDVK